jgi:hypothetical protein
VKVRIALFCLAGLLLFSAAAEASSYFLPFGQARRISKVWAREACEASGPSCTTWKVGHCARIRADRVDCAADNVYGKRFCVFVIENRVMGNGYIHQRRRHTRCK